MRKFEISFIFEADDNWLKEDVKDMVETIIDPIYHLGDSSVSKIIVKKIEVEE